MPIIASGHIIHRQANMPAFRQLIPNHFTHLYGKPVEHVFLLLFLVDRPAAQMQSRYGLGTQLV